MDRKAWLVVTLCIVGIVVNAYYAAKNRPPPAPAKPAITAPATPGAAVAEKTADAAAPGAQTPVSGSAALPEQKHTITNGTVTFVP